MPLLKNLIILSLLLGRLAWASDFAEVLTCAAELRSYSPEPVQLRLLANLHVLAIELPQISDRPVPTTNYALATTLKSLRITREQLAEKFSGKTVLLIGEGMGELLPALIEAGAHVKAVDPLYALKDLPASEWRLSRLNLASDAHEEIARMRGYLNTYREYLIPGISFDLPVPEGSFDYVISNMLINNFYPISSGELENRARRLIQHTILESGRALKPGGTAYHTMIGVTSELIRYTRGILSPAALVDFRYPRMHVAVDEDIPLTPRLIEDTAFAREFNLAHVGERVPSRLITVTRL